MAVRAPVLDPATYQTVWRPVPVLNAQADDNALQPALDGPLAAGAELTPGPGALVTYPEFEEVSGSLVRDTETLPRSNLGFLPPEQP